MINRSMDYSLTYHNQDYVYKEIKNYFNINELVAPSVISKYGEDQCWSFLDFRLLSNLLYIRVKRGLSITVNHGAAIQRGLRENVSQIVKKATDANRIYLSGHVLGMAVDFNEKNTAAEDTRMWIKTNERFMPFKCRFEHKKGGLAISWVHMDVAYFEDYPIVYLFDV